MKERNEIPCPMCRIPMKPVGAGTVYACANKAAECGNYGVPYRPPKVVPIDLPAELSRR